MCSFSFLNAPTKYTYCGLQENKTLFILWEWEWALLARYFYTYQEFVIVTEALQWNRITITGQETGWDILFVYCVYL